MKNHLLSPTQMAALRERFERCKTQILALDWVTQGSLSQSPQGNWRWTRKVKAKTVTSQQVLLICKVTALNQPRIRQLVLDVRVVNRSCDEAGDAKGGLHDDHGQQ